MRSHYCGHVNESLIDKEVTLCGWVHRRRDHGGVIFVDLRDREGLVQVVANPELKDLFKVAESVRNEYVICVKGQVRHRPEGTVNEELPSGKIEVVAEELKILNRADPVPFRIDEYQEVGEEVSLRYRYLDLRRPEMAERIQFRSRVTHAMRSFLDKRGFLDIETPFLTKSTPEGARDYLVPSRVHPGEFYALPQSPQIFKQLLMIAGMDRYYQIVRCDRQPEFTQLDIEMSFVEEADIQQMAEDLIRELFLELKGIKLPDPFPRISLGLSLQIIRINIY